MRTTAIAIASFAIVTTAAVDTQSPPTFEVTSIRRNMTPNQQGGGMAAPQPGGRFVAIGATLRRLVAYAYDDVQVFGGPGWVDTDRFDVNARAAGDRPPAEIVRMVRSLLEDRFKLVVHTETREMPIYTLTLARADRKPGPKLRETDTKCAQESRNFIPIAASGFPPPCGDFRLGARALIARAMTMPALAKLLRARVGRPVTDQTGLVAPYDFEIDWSSDLGLNKAPPDSAGAAELTPEGLSLFTAMQEQLGLRLTAARGAVDVLVIDRAEAPTPD